MTIEEYCQLTDLLAVSELEKVRLISFYYRKTKGLTEFDKELLVTWFDELELPQPNLSRLIANIRKSRAFIRGKSKASFRLHANEIDEMQSLYPGVHIESEDIVSNDVVIPQVLYANSRGFVESLSKQINACYEYNIYDGCAVLMRRLLEILLILAFEYLCIENEIQDSSGQYRPLEAIINNAKQNRKLKLSRDSKAVLDDFRKLGNFSAHKIYYNCRKADLKDVLVMYRAMVEELLYRSGIRV